MFLVWDLAQVKTLQTYLPGASLQAGMLLGICSLKLPFFSFCGSGTGSWEWEGKSQRIFVRHLGEAYRDGEGICEKPAGYHGSVADLARRGRLYSVSFPSLNLPPSLPPQGWLLMFLEFQACFQSPQLSPSHFIAVFL